MDYGVIDYRFHRVTSSCTCSQSCNFHGAIIAVRMFASLNEYERITVVRGVLLALESPAGEPNQLRKKCLGSKKRPHSEVASADMESTTSEMTAQVQSAFQGHRL